MYEPNYDFKYRSKTSLRKAYRRDSSGEHEVG